jgi:hypothetical protein
LEPRDAHPAFNADPGRLPIAPTTLLLAGAAGAVIRWGAVAFDPPSILLPPLQCLHALSFGASISARSASSRARYRPSSALPAQGYLAVALGLVMAASMALPGVLYARGVALPTARWRSVPLPAASAPWLLAGWHPAAFESQMGLDRCGGLRAADHRRSGT